MKLSENTLITELARRFEGTVPAGHLGIGDDCAFIPKAGENGWLITTDLLAEGVHFLKNKIAPEDLGWKALAVNLSDLAAKGASPTYAFLSLAVEAETDPRWIKEFYDGFASLARMSGTILLGGDTSRSEKGCFINVLVIGRAPEQELKLRKRAEPGDLICVTGTLGDSAAGLQLQGKKNLTPVAKKLVRRHHRPEPHLEEGRWLTQAEAVHAMMDLSDGLLTDLPRILEASHCGAKVETDLLPISKELASTAKAKKWSSKDLALTGGEDYGLLLTVEEKSFEKLATDFSSRFKTKLTAIGTIEKEKGLRIQASGKLYTPKTKSYRHF